MNAIATIETSAAPALLVSDAAKSFRGHKAVDGASFSIPKGSLTVILGAAGAGKTTMLRMIAGLEQADAGAIVLNGRDSAGLEPKDRDLAMIFDNLALYPDKSGFENIANPLRIRSLGKDEIEQRVLQVAATLKITHVLARKPKTMSGGERQRVALGRALVRSPGLFLLDEPLSSLDAMLRIELRGELRRLQRELGYTFLFATPDFAEAMAVADTVIMLREGRVVQIAPPQTLYDLPVDREVARFVGAPEINLVPARFEPGNGGRVTIAGAAFPAAPGFMAMNAATGFDFEAGLRPEHLTLVPPGTGGLQGTVLDIEALGVNAAVTVETGGIELRLVTTASSLLAVVPGDRTGIAVSSARMLAFDAASGERLF